MLDQEQSNSEINLHLKMPPEQTEGDFSMKNLVLTIYNARGIFLIWCVIGLVLGILGAGAYYFMNRDITIPPAQGDITVTLTLNYDGAENSLFPNGAPFDARFFYEEVGVWENAIRSIGNNTITVGDAISQVSITRQMQGDAPSANSFILSIPSNSVLYGSVELKKEFLKALCREYQQFVIDKYYSEASTGLLYNQMLRQWDDATTEITWDPFRFDTNLIALSDRYRTMSLILASLHDSAPAYRSPEGKSFDDYASEFRAIYTIDVSTWIDRLSQNIYIRNIDRFIEEADFRIGAMERNRDYYLEVVGLYNDLLASFQQSDGQGVVVREAVDMLQAAQAGAAAAADLRRQIDQTYYYLETLEENEDMIRDNSRAAEAALTGLIYALSQNTAYLRTVIYDYYAQTNERAAENSVIYSSALFVTSEEQPPVGGVSTTRLLMILIGVTFVGFLIGFCATFIRKYVAEQKNLNQDAKHL